MRYIALIVDADRSADATRFFAAGGLLLDLLDALAEVAGVRWSIESLRQGSAVVELSAVGEAGPAGREAAHQALEGLETIQSGGDAPSTWSPRVVALAKDLVRQGDTRARLEGGGRVVDLDEYLLRRLDSLKPWTRQLYGSVRGDLTGVNVTWGNRASIKPQGGGRVIHVGFPAELAEQMRGALFQFVQVDGRVHQDEEGRAYYISADRVEVVPEPDISWRDLFGYMPDITGGLTITEFLEEVHGES